VVEKKKRNTGVVFLVCAIGFALVAAVLVGTMLSSYTKTAQVLVAVGDIGQYEKIDSSMVGYVSMPVAAVPSDAVTNLDEVEGKYTQASLLKDTVIRQGHIADEVKGGLLAAKLTYTEEPDMRAFALPYDAVVSVGGNVRKEDRVDLIASLSIAEGQVRESNAKIIARNVRVLDVVNNESGIASIIIAASPELVEELVFLLENGKVYASLNPYDADTDAALTDGFYTVDKFLRRHLTAGLPEAPVQEPVQEEESSEEQDD
jgi:Flp pilus assembly protein CpaB